MPPVLKKTLIVFGVLVFVIFLFLLAVGIWGEDLKGYINERRQQAIYNKYITEPQKKLEEAYKKDVVGGRTPEETLELFIAELKKDDLEAASKYYAVEDQKQTYRDWETDRKSVV